MKLGKSYDSLPDIKESHISTTRRNEGSERIIEIGLPNACDYVELSRGWKARPTVDSFRHEKLIHTHTTLY